MARSSRRARWGLAEATALALAGAACAAQPDRPGPAMPAASLEISPRSATLRFGRGIALTAVARDSTGAPLARAALSWATSDPAVVAVDAEGAVRSVGPGTAVVVAASGAARDSSVVTVLPPAGEGVVLVGAGDIAECGSDDHAATARLLDSLPGTVFTAGDNAYPSGTVADFANCYDPTWGRHRARTRPAPGNHDYRTADGGPYYAYFGAAAGDSGLGWYSYDLGAWHVISLNSNASMRAGSAQERWLRADLAATSRRCVVAYWHHPRFSSSRHGSSRAPRPLWQALYDANAEVVIVGHDHTYERFAPQTPDGARDDDRGIRQFVAGTGGKSHYAIEQPIANSEAYSDDTYGVLKLTLYPDAYSWEFVPVAGRGYRDAGSGTCR